MGWQDLLQKADEMVVVPWVGGRVLRTTDRVFNIEGKLPPEFGWHIFRVNGRKVRWEEPTTPPDGKLIQKVSGYLVGDRLVPDHIRVDPDVTKIVACSEQVFLIDDGLDRFARIQAGRPFEDGPLVYEGPGMPLGPEDDVMKAFLDQEASVDKIRGVPPALDAAFRAETWQRAEAERRRIEIERIRREEQERLEREEKRRQLFEKIGSAEGRRALAKVDFAEAARAALAVGDALYLDHRKSARKGEMVVRFRVDRRRFECTCDEATLRIVDAGICLTSHGDDGWDYGEKGDTFFTLESLPSVIREAEREGKLVVFRHVN